ncbi:MAG TPA: endonuclease/exonuclease/phosphatase family protein [Pirellulales bacterium]|nr:endonuclease/exonuclease/phosphatase family protein [Pirellulales bacterium]
MPASRRNLGRTVAAGLVLACLTWYAGDQRQPIPAARGTALSGEGTSATAKARTIRVATFNIHGGIGRDLRRDLDRTARPLNDFDFVLLNEVHGPYFWQSQGQTEELARRTGKRWLFAPTEERWWHHRFGNAILSSADVAWWQRIPLPGQTRGHRNLVLTAVKQGDCAIHVIATHLDRNDSAARADQLASVIELFLSLAEPVIMMGDLNTTADERPLATLLARADVHDTLRDAMGSATPRSIDWILTRGLKTVAAGVVDNGASDHPLLWAELEINDELQVTNDERITTAEVRTREPK